MTKDLYLKVSIMTNDKDVNKSNRNKANDDFR